MRRAWIFAWAWCFGAVLAAEAQGPYNGVKVANLPACTLAKQGRLQTVNDANPDCSTGSGTAGSNYAICVCDPVLGWQTFEHGDGYITGAAVGGGLVEVGDTLGLLTSCANGQILKWTAAGPSWGCADMSSGSGTVTSVTVTTANGVSATVANSTTTPNLTFTLGAITPTSVAASSTVTGSNLSGTNTGDQTTITGNAGTATALAANGTNCSTGEAATGTDASGNAEGCAAFGTLGGSTGSTDKALLLANGTGGATVQASPNITQDSSNNLILGDSSGARSLWFSSVSTAPTLKRAGDVLMVVGNDGAQRELNVGWLAAGVSTSPSTFQGGLQVGNTKRACFSDGVDYSRCVERVSSTLTITDGSGSGVSSARDLRVRAIRHVPQSSPPYTCDSTTEGTIYADAEDHAPCFCTGTAWVPVFGAGSCS